MSVCLVLRVNRHFDNRVPGAGSWVACGCAVYETVNRVRCVCASRRIATIRVDNFQASTF